MGCGGSVRRYKTFAGDSTNYKEGAKMELEFPTLRPSDFNTGVTLGTGSFARVRFATHCSSGKHVALKFYKKTVCQKSNQIERVKWEVDALRELGPFPFLVQLLGVCQDERHLLMVMEFVPGGELFSHLRRAGRFSSDMVNYFTAQVVLYLCHIHSYGWIDRGLKPEDFLVDSKGNLKRVDLGFAKKIIGERTFSLVGTPEYLPPEIVLNKGHGSPVDVWACGILTYEMLVGYPPFYSDGGDIQIYEKILAGKIKFPSYVSGAHKTFIQNTVRSKVNKRWSADECKKARCLKGVDMAKMLSCKLQSPLRPPLSSETDTSNYDYYPESSRATPPFEFTGRDPFDGWAGTSIVKSVDSTEYSSRVESKPDVAAVSEQPEFFGDRDSRSRRLLLRHCYQGAAAKEPDVATVTEQPELSGDLDSQPRRLLLRYCYQSAAAKEAAGTDL